MGLLDDILDQAEALGEKAKDGFETVKDKASDGFDTVKDKASDGVDAARDKAADLIGDVRDRFDGEDSPADEITPAAEKTGAADATPDPYDEVLEAAEHKAESLKHNPGPV